MICLATFIVFDMVLIICVFFCKTNIMGKTCNRVIFAVVMLALYIFTVIMATVDGSTGVYWRPYML